MGPNHVEVLEIEAKDIGFEKLVVILDVGSRARKKGKECIRDWAEGGIGLGINLIAEEIWKYRQVV